MPAVMAYFRLEPPRPLPLQDLAPSSEAKRLQTSVRERMSFAGLGRTCPQMLLGGRLALLGCSEPALELGQERAVCNRRGRGRSTLHGPHPGPDRVGLKGISLPTNGQRTFEHQRGARIKGAAALPPTPSGSGEADVARASQVQHAVEHVDGDVHLGRPTLICMRA